MNRLCGGGERGCGGGVCVCGGVCVGGGGRARGVKVLLFLVCFGVCFCFSESHSADDFISSHEIPKLSKTLAKNVTFPSVIWQHHKYFKTFYNHFLFECG